MNSFCISDLKLLGSEKNINPGMTAPNTLKLPRKSGHKVKRIYDNKLNGETYE
jgi:hypothetical protein